MSIIQRLFQWEQFEDTKGVIKIRKSKKHRQHNGQKKQDKQHNGQKKQDKQRYTNIQNIAQYKHN